ncbi:MAG: hypothetical protein KDD50_00885, partial [Bdellovibrionales bacterium]|nr:hypothetical protein [Bdellovibrionales bacterium]
MAIDLSRIDINTPPEEQEIKILLVVENQDRYESTAAFLTKRGWPTVVKNSVEGAILHYTQQSPHFVVVSLSHKSKKISKLPTILAQTFNANCIVFLERNDSLGIKRMNSSSIRNKMHENVSGPSLSRKIKKLIQDTQDYEKEVDKKLLSERNAIGDDVINISGDKQDSNYRVSGNADGPDTYRFSQDKKYSELSAAEKLKQLQEQLGGPESNDDGDRSGIGYMPDQSSDPSGYGMSNHNRGLGIESDSKGPQKGSLSQNESSVDSKETDLDSGLEMFGSIDGNQNADGQLNRDEGLADGKEYLSKDQSSTASLDSKGRDSLDSSNNETDATLANRENHQPNLWTKETGDKKSHLPDLQNQKDGKKENHKPSDDSTSVKSKENDLP